ncbi:alpha/beta hydrolase [Streptosporangium sp. NPDC051023]|uniref:alpha/beta fold hydrolase n=1 Tax=Streptosporangium sp. NPDC051023 TaxID=3155410 RepID=UPI00344E2F99
MRRFLLIALALLAVVAVAPAAGAAAEPRVPPGFHERKAHVNGIDVNYVRGGRGPTLVLLHGYPETWYEWRAILPALAEHFTVVAPDLRGAGGSSVTRGGYDKRTMAADLEALLTRLGLDHDINLVGHDIGTMVAYAYAARHQDKVARLVLSEAPIPDDRIFTFPTLTSTGPGFWNFGFFDVRNGLPEQMIAGREETWIGGFIRMLAVHQDRAADPRAVREYARLLSTQGSFGWFRALRQDVADNQRLADPVLRMPVLAVGADHSLGSFVPDQVRSYASDVRGVVVKDSGHWIFEEQPKKMTRLLLDFLLP